jgi:very-short-patch-repair endonuclease
MCPKISSKKTYRQARHLRHNLTQAEARLWSHLRAHRLADVHFRRQYAIGIYIVDFCAPRKKLIIEIDGSQHLNSEEADINRAAYFISKGFRILRFWNQDVMNDLDGVVKAIELALKDDKL